MKLGQEPPAGEFKPRLYSAMGNTNSTGTNSDKVVQELAGTSDTIRDPNTGYMKIDYVARIEAHKKLLDSGWASPVLKTYVSCL